jgi:hypothetical protein
MGVSLRYFTLAAVTGLAAAMLLTQARGQATGITKNQVQPTPTVAPTPTAIIPSALQLLSQASGSTDSMGSVLEVGHFHSSNNAVYDGFRLWANFSWKHQVFRDHHVFAKPAYINKSLGYSSDVRRFAIGWKTGMQVNGKWSCGHQPPAKSAVLWQPPSFALTSPRVVGTVHVEGQAVWDVRGEFAHRFAGQSSHITVDLFINKSSGLYVQARESGWSRNGQGRSAQVTGMLDYSSYGRPVHVTIPKHCRP